MRLYNIDGATQVANPDYGTFDADDNGAFDFPDELATHLHRQPSWEDDAERQDRLDIAEAERRADPATLLAAVEQLTAERAAPKSRPRKPAKSV